MRIVRRPGVGGGETAVAIGSFDGVHRGHAAILGRLREKSRLLGLQSAVLTFEPLPREHFTPGSAPARLASLREKLAAIAGLGIERAVVERFDARFAALTPEAFAERLRHVHGARWVVVGADFRFGARRAGDAATLRELGQRLGFEVEVMGAIDDDGERVSSTRVRAALEAGDCALAARLLGRPYVICGRVLHGHKVGRTWGFPTANVALGRARPALSGVFAVRCLGATTRGLEGVASLGPKPAVQTGGPATLEAFLFDFQGDLYGRLISIEFVKKLRDEAHFASLDELRAQIARDCEAARECFRDLETP